MESIKSKSKFPIKRERRREKASERILISKKELGKEDLSYFDALWVEHKCAYEFAVPYINDRVVLDLGCGSGYGTYYLSTKGAKYIIGVDISKEVIKYCKGQYSNENLQYGTMNGSRLAFKDNSFDNVISFQVIEHIKNLDNYLSEVRRVARMFIVSTPNKKTYNASGRNPFHIREFYLKDLQFVLQSVFQEVEMFGVYPTAQIQDLGNKVEKLEGFVSDLHLRPVLDLSPLRIRKVLGGRLFRIDEDTFYKVCENPSEDCLDIIAVCS